MVYTNNSIIPITDIGEGDSALQCITDRMPCCGSAGNRIGQWLFPDTRNVPDQSSTSSFFQSRGNSDGTVNLNRNDDVMEPIGLFCCVVPDATGTNQMPCVNVGE